MFLDEASVTATENAVMAAVLAEGETVIYNAAAEPHVQDLCRFLNLLGAEIEGIATNSLRIRGVDSLHGGEFHIPSDHIEVGSYIGLAAVTRIAPSSSAATGSPAPRSPVPTFARAWRCCWQLCARRARA